MLITQQLMNLAYGLYLKILLKDRKMDERAELINKVSQDILSRHETTFEVVQNDVAEYSKMFNAVIRNYYELESMGKECPLFQLCYYIRVSKDNFGFEDEEFAAEVKALTIATNKMFNVEIGEM